MRRGYSVRERLRKYSKSSEKRKKNSRERKKRGRYVIVIAIIVLQLGEIIGISLVPRPSHTRKRAW